MAIGVGKGKDVSDAVPSTSPRKRLRLHQRLRESDDFRRAYDARNSWHGASVVVFFRPNGLPFSRMGVSVSRKHGSAVVRNRLKRILREAFRLDQAVLPSGFDYVLIPRRGVSSFELHRIREQLTQLAGEMQRRTDGRTRREGT